MVGAEVHYFDGMSHTEELPLLTLESTNILLLEMPFGPWSQRMVEEVLEIQTRRNLQVLLAHVERYQSFRQFGSDCDRQVCGLNATTRSFCIGKRRARR